MERLKGVGLLYDADTDDQKEDQEHHSLLRHPCPHLAPTGSKSAEGSWGNQR